MSTVRKVIESCDATNELEAAQKEALEALYTVAEQQADIFMMEIMDSIKVGGDKKIPVTSLVAQTKEIRAMTAKSTEDIQATVSGCLDAFLGGNKDVVGGIEKLLSGALNVFLGESVGAVGQTEKYYILTEGLSAVRFDVKCWYRSIQCKSLYSKAEKVTCFVGTKSIVDLSKIDLSTFVYLYQQQLMNSGVTGADIRSELKLVKEIYNEFQSSVSGNSILKEIRKEKNNEILVPGF